MLLLHSADWHIGANRTFPNYLARQMVALEELLSIAYKFKVETLIAAGDLLDSSSPKHEERIIIADFFLRSKVPIVAITGTHELYGKHWHETSLNWLVALAKKLGHRVWDKPTAEEFNGVWWLALPYHRYGQLDLVILVNWLVSQVPTTWTGPVVLLSHQTYYGSSLDVGLLKESQCLKLQVPERITYVALGDIHKPQRLDERVYYSGSLYQKTFAEQKPKGVFLVDTEKNQPEFVELVKPQALISLSEIPEKWPSDYIELSLRPDLVPSFLPENVVQLNSKGTGIVNENLDQFYEKRESNYLLQGLDKFLLTRGLTEEQITTGLNYAEALVNELRKEGFLT